MLKLQGLTFESVRGCHPAVRTCNACRLLLNVFARRQRQLVILPKPLSKRNKTTALAAVKGNYAKKSSVHLLPLRNKILRLFNHTTRHAHKSQQEMQNPFPLPYREESPNPKTVDCLSS